ncbi:hypothetical protein Syun_005129 [Stephania yunnanensis]|uniref:Uncharacterized protein n=1 Tax=Stephania yunnanensis TaxID=152371 RepID=A0AAP0Q1F8_9MAGN
MNLKHQEQEVKHQEIKKSREHFNEITLQKKKKKKKQKLNREGGFEFLSFGTETHNTRTALLENRGKEKQRFCTWKD